MGSGQMGTGQQRPGQLAMGAMLVRGGSVLGATLLFVLGVYHFFTGIAGWAQSSLYSVGPTYPYSLSSTGWGWLHVVGGAVLALTGLSLFSPSATWARPVAIVLLAYSLILNFFFLVYFPLWALPMIALALVAIWAIARVSSESRQREAMMGSQAMMAERGTAYGTQQQAGGQQQAAYVSSGAHGAGANQAGQRWPENVSDRDESGGRQWAPSDVKEGAGRAGEKAQEQEQAQSGARNAAQAGRNAAEEAADRARQGAGRESRGR